MAIVTIFQDSVGGGIRVNLGTDNDVRVNAGVLVQSTGDYGVFGFGTDHFANVLGIIRGGGAAAGILFSGNGFGGGHSVKIGREGEVSGFNAIRLTGANLKIENRGVIEGSSTAIDLSSGGDYRIDNFNTITSSSGIGISASDTQGGRLINSGVITGDTAAFSGGGGSDAVSNSGRMVGNVALGNGNDIYDGRGGRVSGTVFGNDGFDVFVPGAKIDRFDGGANADSLNLRSAGGTTVDLTDNGRNTGTAKGDTYVGIETIRGSSKGPDRFFGTDISEAFYGEGGADRLVGRGGTDRLIGGAGKDALTGGDGSDLFIFTRRADGGDRITDFTSGSDKLYFTDAFGLLVGDLDPSQFRSRPDNRAQDANDRFIFRTTDKTLWFDGNGKAPGGLTLIADLQPGAQLTAADIELF